jgi:hypothetical protein
LPSLRSQNYTTVAHELESKISATIGQGSAPRTRGHFTLALTQEPPPVVRGVIKEAEVVREAILTNARGLVRQQAAVVAEHVRLSQTYLHQVGLLDRRANSCARTLTHCVPSMIECEPWPTGSIGHSRCDLTAPSGRCSKLRVEVSRVSGEESGSSRGDIRRGRFKAQERDRGAISGCWRVKEFRRDAFWTGSLWRWRLARGDEGEGCMRGALWTGSLLPLSGVSARRLRIERFTVGGPMSRNLQCCWVGGRRLAVGGVSATSKASFSRRLRSLSRRYVQTYL